MYVFILNLQHHHLLFRQWCMPRIKPSAKSMFDKNVHILLFSIGPIFIFFFNFCASFMLWIILNPPHPHPQSQTVVYAQNQALGQIDIQVSSNRGGSHIGKRPNNRIPFCFDFRTRHTFLRVKYKNTKNTKIHNVKKLPFALTFELGTPFSKWNTQFHFVYTFVETGNNSFLRVKDTRLFSVWRDHFTRISTWRDH